MTAHNLSIRIERGHRQFDPVWTPRYLASPGTLKLPRILADIAALVAGAYRRVLLK